MKVTKTDIRKALAEQKFDPTTGVGKLLCDCDSTDYHLTSAKLKTAEALASNNLALVEELISEAQRNLILAKLTLRKGK